MSLSDGEYLDWLSQYTSRLQDVYWHIENEGGDVRSAIDFLRGDEQDDQV